MSTTQSDKRVKVLNIYMHLLMLFPLTTLAQNSIDVINRVLFAFVFILQINILSKKITAKNMFFLLAALIVYSIVVLNTSNVSFDNSYVYYVNWLIYSVVFIRNKREIISWLKRERRYIRSVVIIWTILVGISIFLPSSYYIKEGGARYFGSFVGDIFRLGPTALFVEILSALLVVLYKKKIYFIFEILPIYCGLMGSSRTYFVSVTIVFVISVFILFEKKSHRIMAAAPISVLGFYFLVNSNLAEKIVYTFDPNQYGDFWYRVTSSRSLIWERIINAYLKLDFLRKLFGGGIGFSNAVALHYSHNDFIEITVTYGIIGLILYIISVSVLVRSFFKKNSKMKVLYFLAIALWFFNAFFNMFFFYTCAVISLPVLLCTITIWEEDKDKKPWISRSIKRVPNH